MKTSISDEAAYREICRDAAYTRMFEKFRSNPIYTKILEHVSEEHGRQYAEIVRERYDLDRNGIFKRHMLSDYFGSPKKIDVWCGSWSPTTLRYLKVLCDLMPLFPDEVESIVEIGGGYGGQAKIILDRFPVEYGIYDLPEAQLLAERFLRACGHKDQQYRMLTLNHEPEECDLLISNYAFSELTRREQGRYLPVIAKAARGYVTYNQISTDFGIDSMSRNEFVEWLNKTKENVRVEDEHPLTFEGNVVITWGL